jgi:hypothetical protein
MSDELGRLHGLVGALARRERALLVWQTALRGAALLALVLAVAAAVVWRDVPRAYAVTWIVLVAGGGAWFLVAAPWASRWRRAGDPLRQARLLEARDPELRGRLVTAVGHTVTPAGQGATRGQESPALLALVARRALERASRQDPREVHPVGPLRRWGGTAASAWLVALLGVFGGPGGGPGVWRWWFGGGDASAAVAGGTLLDAGASAHVGDLTLRYVYPAYTGLEPYVVVNSTGEAHAPPGTRVEVVARTGEVVEAASLVAYDQPALDAVVQADGRTLSGSFVVQAKDGSYELVTHAGGETRRSRRFPIVADPDLPPEVTLAVPEGVFEVAVDQPLDLRWTATDDYGIARVALEVDHKEVGGSLKIPSSRVATREAVATRRPSDLGMEPGKTYELVVVAWDNDTVSGSKPGRSSVLRIVVVGEDGVGRMDDALRAELLDVLVGVLAGSLEEAYPPGRAAGDYARWGEKVDGRYQPLATFMDQHRGRRSTDPIWPPVDAALADARTLVRFTQTSFLPGSAERANDASVSAVATYRDTAVASLEAAALHVDRMLRNRALEQMAEEVENLADASRELEQDLTAANVDVQRLGMDADRLQSYVARLKERAGQLPPGGLQDFAEARLAEASSVLDEAQRALAARNVPDAHTMLDRLSTRLGELAEGLQDELERMQEAAKQQRGKGEDVLKMLKELRERQDALASKVASIEEQGGGAYRKQIADLWQRIEAQARGVLQEVSAYDQGLEANGRTFNERSLVDEAVERAQVVKEGAVARDLAGLTRQTLELNAHWSRYADRWSRLWSGTPVGPGRAELLGVQDGIDQLIGMLEQLTRKDAEGDPTMRAQVSRLEADQRQLAQDLEDAKGKARQAAQEMSVTPRALEPALKAAGERMGEAGEQLGQGEAMQAAGSQRAASRHVDDAIAALQDAMARMKQQQQELDPQQQDGSGQKGEDQQGQQPKPQGAGDQPSDDENKIALPEPEEFRTPEAYREALLEGMEGDVPEEYRALKRRYYEELVHQ